MSDRGPPSDMPRFDSLGNEYARALKVWFFLRMHHGTWFRVKDIAEGIGLAESTTKNALARIFGLPGEFRPRIERRIIEDHEGRIVEYRFRRIIQIIFEK